MRLALASRAVPIVLLAGSCSPAEPAVRTVKEILAQCDSLKGKMVHAAGYLGECAGYECRLFADEAGPQAFQRAFEHRLGARDAIPFPPNIGIGGGKDLVFDAKAAPFVNHYVVISGQIDPHNCTGEGGTDRSYGIDPTDIRAWTPSEGAPANTH